MGVAGQNGAPNGHLAPNGDTIRFLKLSYSKNDSHESALRLVAAIRPDWQHSDSNVQFIRFTDGITNTLLKAVNNREGLSEEEIDSQAILLRAYGTGTDLIIDRQRETQNHELLAHHGLAPELLARFENGMLYRFIRGSVTQSEDLRKPAIYGAVARRLAEWHAKVPCIRGITGHGRRMSRNESIARMPDTEYQRAIDAVAPGRPSPNLWTVMQKWIFALPTETEGQRERQRRLQKELAWLVAELSGRPGLGKDGLVFAHCDLLSGNVIVLPKLNAAANSDKTETVTFIDYEYATPSPAAFDIANHFAEWGGFDCDYNVLPTKKQRREFIQTYVRTYFDMAERPEGQGEHRVDEAVQKLMDEVDIFRGVPGFYWGIWSLIQATISEIDFDYTSYAEVRLGEYYGWRAEVDGSRERQDKEMPLRERRWMQKE